MKAPLKWLAPLLFLTLALLPPPSASSQATAVDSDRLRIGVNYFDIADPDDAVVATEAAYGWNRSLLWGARPQVGGMIMSDGSAYAYAGFRIPLELGRGMTLAPSLGGGLYRRGSETDLGSPVEFRSGVEVSWKAASGHGVALYFYHLSNAGLGSRNPGAEVLGLGYFVPL